MNYKKIIAGALALTLTAGAVALPAAESGIKLGTAISASAADSSNYEQGQYGDFKYTLNKIKNTIEIDEYTGNSNYVEFPPYINGSKVTSIGSVFPNTRVEVTEEEFNNNYNNDSSDYYYTYNEEYNANTDENVIHYYKVFNKNTTITGVSVPGTVKSISGTFKNLSVLTSVNLSNGLNTIGYDAFAGCESLTNITIPNSVTSIGSDAFYNCKSLSSITIPDSVTSIYSGAFKKCTSLLQVTVPGSVLIMGDSVFSECANLQSATIQEGAIDIGSNTFDNCKNLRSVSIPSTINVIPSGTFFGCTGLSTITLPNTIKAIYSNAFNGCTLLQSFNIPYGVRYIGDSAFQGCSNLMSVTIPDTVREIDDEAFYGAGLSNVVVPGSVKNIGENAFGYWYADPEKPDNSTKKVGFALSGCPNTVAQQYAAENGFGFTAVHSFGDWVVTKQATCAKAGSKIRYCSCGATETAAIPKNANHKYVKVKVVAPTSQKQGYTLYKCSVCGKTVKKNYTKKLAADIIGLKESYVYKKGKAITPKIKVKKNGKTLKAGKDYKLTIKNNKKIGVAKVTVKLKKGGTIVKNFSITPATTALKSAKAAKNAVKVTYKKAAYAGGYQVQASESSSFTTAKSANSSKTTATVKGLKSGKKYYVRVRSSKKVGKTTVYSAWSKAKVVKVK